jgi:hypothetical protein
MVLVLATALILAVRSPLSAQDAASAELPRGEWIALFNGRDLDGWTPKIRGFDLGENFGQTFRVEDGLLKVRYDGYEQFDDRFGHLFYKSSFSTYALRVEYRFVGEQAPGGPEWALRNSGVMIHGQDPESIGRDQEFPCSIEVQLLGGDGQHPRPNANLCTPGTHVVMNGQLITRHCTDSTSRTYHGDDWVEVEIEVQGNKIIRHKLEGQVVLEYEQPQLDPDEKYAQPLIADGGRMLDRGSISLQSESHPIDFRRVEIRLPKE